MLDAINNSQVSDLDRKQPKDAVGQSMDELGGEAFLKLMIAQFQNQDPFEPMESGEFLGQLAHLTTASGVGDLQKSFDRFASSMATDQGLRAAGLVGRNVLVESGHGYLPENGMLAGAVKLPSGAGEVNVTIQNAAGERVAELPLGQQSGGQVSFAWDGLGENGQQQPAGRYTIRAELISEGRSTGLDVLASATVDSVSLGKGGESPMLSLVGLGDRSLSAVRHIQ